MLNWLEIYTWEDFATFVGCMARVAAIVIPTAIAIYFFAKLLKKVLTWLMGMIK